MNIGKCFLVNCNKDIHTVIMSTAHPFKFPLPVAEALDLNKNRNPYEILDEISSVTNIEFPKKLDEVRKSEIRFSKIIDKTEIENFVKEYIKTLK